MKNSVYTVYGKCSDNSLPPFWDEPGALLRLARRILGEEHGKSD
jgi:hypothetical protein